MPCERSLGVNAAVGVGGVLDTRTFLQDQFDLNAGSRCESVRRKLVLFVYAM